MSGTLTLAVALLAVSATLALAALLYYYRLRRIMQRLHTMLDGAVAGTFSEKSFDESELAAVESKLYRYLSRQQLVTDQIAHERAEIATLIADISHQTKTPVANILLYTQLLGEQPLPPELRPYVEALTASADKLSFLVGSMVKSSRLENGIIAVSPCCCAVGELLDEVVAQATPAAVAASITLTATPTDITAILDPKWTAEAVWNIVDNAVKYTPSGGKVVLSVQQYEMFTRIDVTDNGIGIDEGEHAKVFGRFYRSPQVEHREGVGLGLYLAREIITAQSGYIKLSSHRGVGTTFSVFLPAARENLAKL